jgi:hypothetical protein
MEKVYSNVIIRSACEEDIPAILELYSQLGMDEGKTLTSEDAQKNLSWMKSYPDYSLYVSAIDEEEANEE